MLFIDQSIFAFCEFLLSFNDSRKRYGKIKVLVYEAQLLTDSVSQPGGLALTIKLDSQYFKRSHLSRNQVVA